MIHQSGGIAVLAHPAWSLNTPEQILSAGDFDAVEIYNSVSECGMSDRPYSGLIVDMLAVQGMILPLLATDDTHYYNGDECRGMVMVEAEATEELVFLHLGGTNGNYFLYYIFYCNNSWIMRAFWQKDENYTYI